MDTLHISNSDGNPTTVHCSIGLEMDTQRWTSVGHTVHLASDGCPSVVQCLGGLAEDTQHWTCEGHTAISR